MNISFPASRNCPKIISQSGSELSGNQTNSEAENPISCCLFWCFEWIKYPSHWHILALWTFCSPMFSSAVLEQLKLNVSRRCCGFMEQLKAAAFALCCRLVVGCKEMKSLMKDFYLLSLLTSLMTSGINLSESEIAQFSRKVCWLGMLLQFLFRSGRKKKKRYGSGGDKIFTSQSKASRSASLWLKKRCLTFNIKLFGPYSAFSHHNMAAFQHVPPVTSTFRARSVCAGCYGNGFYWRR